MKFVKNNHTNGQKVEQRQTVGFQKLTSQQTYTNTTSLPITSLPTMSELKQYGAFTVLEKQIQKKNISEQT